MEKIKIDTEFIKLDQFLKMVNIAGSGGQAKRMLRLTVQSKLREEKNSGAVM